MTHPSLAGVDLKLARADECLAFLDRERTVLLSAKGHRVVGHFDAGAGEYVFRVPGKGPPLAWGVTVGDFAHMLRSSLDNLLWQLVIARGGTPSTGRDGIRKIGTQFPIYEEEAEFSRKAHGSTLARVQTFGVLEDDFTFIEGEQPYKAGPDLAKWHPLAMLGYLNNVDKHRYIHAAFAAAAMSPLSGVEANRTWFQSYWADWGRRVRPPKGATHVVSIDDSPVAVRDISLPNIYHINYNGSDDDPAEVLRVGPAVATGPDPHMEMKPGFLLDVSFSYRERPMNIFDLKEVRTAVEEIVERFRPHIG